MLGGLGCTFPGMHGGASAAEKAAAPVALPTVTVEGDRFARARGPIPESHAFLSGPTLDSQVAADAFAVLDRAANTSLGFAHDTPFSIRGVGNNAVTPGLIGRVAPVASVHYDGIAATPTQVDYFRPTLWDVATVSVFRGPISTSRGVNALIGGLFLRFAEPTFAPEGRVRVRASGDATYEGAVMQNLPLIPGHLALRFAAEHRESEGSARNLTRRMDDWMRVDQDHVRGLLRWQPRDDDALRIDFLLRHERSDSPNAATVRALPPNGSFFDRLADANDATEAHGSNLLAALTVHFRFSADTTLAAITAWQLLKTRDTFDLDYTARPLAFGGASLSERSLSQELQWRRALGTLQLLAGGYAEHAGHLKRYATFLSIPGLPSTNTILARINSDTVAAFAQAVWRIAPPLTLEAGLRLHHESREVAIDSRNDGYGIPTRGTRDDNVISPRLSVTWMPNPGTHFGALVSHGFRGGGISSALLLARTRAYEPEHAWNYELFLRHEPGRGRFWMQANAYFMDWRRQQVSVPLPGGVPGPDDVVFNAGRSRLHGFELEAGWRLAPRWSAFAALGHEATKFVTFVHGGANYAGDPFPNAPKWNASLGGGYGFDDTRAGLFGGMTLTWRDSTYSTIGRRGFTALEARTLLSARIGWRWQNGLSVYAQGENLLDDDFAYTRIDRRIFGVPGPVGRASQPRTFGVGAEFAW